MLAKRYARALLALASEDGTEQALGDALGQAAAVLATPSIATVIYSPAVGLDGRRAVVHGLIENLGLPRLLANCLYLLAERGRLDIVDDLAHVYVELLDQRLGRSRVVVRSAVQLTDEQVQEILGALRGRVGTQELIPEVEVDSELLGGVVCEVEGVVYDGSIRTQVGRLARRMVT
jgi:F-type H+-transporting ATPase subunit delta